MHIADRAGVGLESESDEGSRFDAYREGEGDAEGVEGGTGKK